jgi:DNA recombination protein RmuC
MILGVAIGILVGAAAVWLWARGEIRRRDDRLTLVQRSDEQWEEHLKALTSDVLGVASSSLIERAGEQLTPIKETLEKFETQSRALETKRLADVAAIPRLLTTMTEGQAQLRKETGNLVTALRSPNVRGRWGEIQLKRVVELAGMVKHCDFDEQPTERTDEGRLLRPDLIVKLAGGKNVLVDSKAPLEAYLDAIAADDEVTRQAHLSRHARLVRDHMTQLGQKGYWKTFGVTPEFVFMFMGDEGFFRAALDHDPSLLEAGIESGVVRVIPASPTTLIAMLRTIAYAWQQEAVAESAREVGQLGRELYERLGTFAKHFSKIGRSLDTAVGSYNEAVGSFESRVLVSARKFSDHGITSDAPPETPIVERQTRPFFAPELDVPEDVIDLPSRTADAA